MMPRRQSYRGECVHCGLDIEGQPLRSLSGYRPIWVHVDGGSQLCNPGRGASSPKATPKEPS